VNFFAILTAAFRLKRMCSGIISALAFPLPDPHWGADALQKHPGFIQLVTLKNERVPAVLIKCNSARYTILYSHGNAEDVSISLEYLEDMAQACQANVLAYEYVGYSLSALDGAKPSEAGCFRAIETAWRYLVLTLNMHAKTIIVLGRSLGSCICSVHIYTTLSCVCACVCMYVCFVCMYVCTYMLSPNSTSHTIYYVLTL
jgi:hypothetical protein